MRILIAPDSFKESLSAKEVALALKSGFEKALPDAEFDLMPIGDGGEGTLDALAENLNLEKKSIEIPHAYTSDGSVLPAMARLPFLKWLRFVAWSIYLKINAILFV